LGFIEKVMMSIFFLQTLQLIKLCSRGIFQEKKNRNGVFEKREQGKEQKMLKIEMTPQLLRH